MIYSLPTSHSITFKFIYIICSYVNSVIVQQKIGISLIIQANHINFIMDFLLFASQIFFLIIPTLIFFFLYAFGLLTLQHALVFSNK